MKLLFDQNISYRIIKLLSEFFPESKHVKEVGLENCTDAEIWEFARLNNYVVVTFDADFYDMSVLMGIPPKIIWLRIGNTSTMNLSHTILKNKKLISEFCNEENPNACLEIY